MSGSRIPTSHVLLPSRLNINKKYVVSGDFSDVFQGTHNDREVCVKRLRVASTGSPEDVATGCTRDPRQPLVAF